MEPNVSKITKNQLKNLVGGSHKQLVQVAAKETVVEKQENRSFSNLSMQDQSLSTSRVSIASQ